MVIDPMSTAQRLDAGTAKPAVKRIVVLGATGSIGQSTIDVIRAHPECFAVEALVGNSNIAALARDALALGAKCAQPDRPVVCFTGDSGFWYHVAEIETAVRWGINSITVVNNNHSGNQSKRGFDRVYGGKQTEKALEMWVFTEVDFAGLAEHIGAIGIRVEKPADLASAFDRALSADRPVVLDVVTDIDALAPPAVE